MEHSIAIKKWGAVKQSIAVKNQDRRTMGEVTEKNHLGALWGTGHILSIW